MPDLKAPVAFSELLRQLCTGGYKVSVRQMVDHFGHRAFGAVFFTFALPNVLPLPPGASGVLGLPLVLVAPQLMLGRKSLWLPSWIGDRQIERAGLSKALKGFLPVLSRIERLSCPRWTGLFGPFADRVLGLVCFLLALIQRDGLIGVVGYVMAASSWLVLGLSFTLILTTVQHLLVFFGL